MSKSLIAERFIRTLKNMALQTLQTYDSCVRKCLFRCFKWYSGESNEKDSKFQIGDHVRVSKYKKISGKGYAPDWSEEVFVISKIKKTVPWTDVISNLNSVEIVGSFYEKELQKTTQ